MELPKNNKFKIYMMHNTLCNDVKGYIDSKTSGWCFHLTYGIRPLRFRASLNEAIELEKIERLDVSSFYNRREVSMCGWLLPANKGGEIQMDINGEWIPIFIKNKEPDINLNFQVTIVLPSFIVVDNFYSDPLSIRNFALQQDFQADIRYFKGKRTKCFRFDGLKERFEHLLNRKVLNWEKYGTNGCFQYCVAEDLNVYHCDKQQYAGVLFLTPDAPIQSGTQFFRSKVTKKMKVAPEEYAAVFAKGYYDSTAFESVDTVGNVFNRIVLFDAQMIHAAPIYFGSKIEDARLFQLFFFDLE